MNPGRELDALIAEKIMGWVNMRINDKPPVDCHFRFGKGDRIGQPPWTTRDEIVLPYSTDIAAAWQVVEHCCDNLENVRLVDIHNAGGWYCKFMDEHGEIVARSGFCNTAPHAICLAALETVK